MLIKLGRRKPKSVQGVVRGAQLYLRLLLAAGVFAGLFSGARAELPVACGGGACAPKGPSQWLTSGNASLSTSGASMTIHQSSDRAILNWQSFNIGKENSVNFQQPTKDSVALNRIWDGDPSKIFGKLTANGEVWLINRNGIVFGENSQVNTGSLIASTLDVSDSVFERGLKTALTEDKAAAFIQSGSGVDAQGNPVGIRLESGAILTAQDGGHIYLFAPAIDNNGAIVTDNGQVVLAAGQKVWLEQGDNDLRGILVEVDGGGTVSNVGDIIAKRGNATLVGLAINQAGRITATTASNVNGSIYLHARDSIDAQTLTTTLDEQTTRSGSVELGGASVTSVIPDLDDTLLITDDQAQPASQVDVMGRNIHLASGAQVIVPGGNVTLDATADPRGSQAAIRNDSRVQMESGSVIDVSGTTDSVASVSRNIIEVELRGLQFADAPLQRDSALRNQQVKIDIRTVDENGNIPIANVKEVVQSVGRGLSERFAAGGTVTLTCEGDVVLNPGSAVDVSGGQVNYAGGMVETTRVISNGRIVDISDADPNAVYSGVAGSYERSYDKWGVTEKYRATGSGSFAHYEAGYVEGKDAGTLNISARGVLLNGEVRGEVTAGDHQRAPATGADTGWARPFGQVPLAGQLVIGDASRKFDARTPDVLFQSGAEAPHARGASEALPPDLALVLAPALFDHGVNRLKVYSNGTITIAKDAHLELDAGGAVSLRAGVKGPGDTGGEQPAIDVQGSISVAGGTIGLDTAFDSNVKAGGIHLGEQAELNVAGHLINDTPVLNPEGAHTATHTSGGKITLSSGGDITLATGSVLNADGGAWLRDDGSLKGGRGGDISIESKYDGAAAIALNGDMHGYGLGKGGTFSLKAPSILSTAQPDIAAVPGQVVLAPEFFQSGGFNAYNISAYRDGLTVANGTQIAPRVQNYVLDPQYRLQTTGSELREFAAVQMLAEDLRTPVNLTLNSDRTEGSLSGDAALMVGAGAHLDLDLGASLLLKSDSLLVVDGALTARGGNIDLKLTDNIKDTYAPDKAIWLGANARLDARAVAQLQPNALGLREGEMLDGGSITLTAERGFIVTEAGSDLNVSGDAQTFDLRVAGSATASYVPVTVTGDAGTIALSASDGMLLDGVMHAHAAPVEGAAGGALSVKLTGADFVETREITDITAPKGVRAIEVTQTRTTSLTEGLQPGDALLSAELISQLRPKQNNSVESVARVSQEQIASGGFDAVTLSVTPVMESGAKPQPDSNAMIRFVGDIDLNLRRSITLDAAVLAATGAEVKLNAPYVALGQSNTALQINTPPLGGDSALKVSADHVDLIGQLSLQGFGSAAQPALSIHSNGDVRLQGVPWASNKYLSGGLRSAGDVVIDAAQIYPSTLTHYTLNVEGAPDGTVRIGSTGTAQAPLSAAGSVEINAPHIVQGGTLRAPFGNITLNGTQDVTLAPGSMTSVSGAGMSVPFGKILLGQNWILPMDGAIEVRVNNDVDDKNNVVTLPEKTVVLKSPVIDQQAGAVVDVAGGGDLTAFEFTPGPGGSSDVLKTGVQNGSFAVVPGLGSQYAPNDPLIGNAGIEIGTTVYLSGVDGLPAGEYAVLPARYALLPGAFLVTQAAAGAVSADARNTRPDGVTTIAGRFGVAGTDTHDSLWSAFTVENGAQLRRRSEYREVTADQFFTAQAQVLGMAGVPELPQDAGSLVLEAHDRLNLSGQFKGESADGRAGRIDVVGDHVAIVSARTPDADRIELVAADLNQLGVQSLLIGGRRHITESGVEFDISATNVELDDGVQLAVPELLLAAQRSDSGASPDDGTVHIGRNVTLTASGEQQPGANDTLVLSGDSALIRVSSGTQANIVRREVPAEGAARVTIDAGAQLSASATAPERLPFGGSIALDAAGDVLNQGELRVADGGALHLGASLISLGETGGRDITQGIVLSNEALAVLNAGQVRLVSASTVDLYGAVKLEAQNLALDSTGLRGIDNDGKSAIVHATNTLQLTNSHGAASVTTGNGHGELQLAAREMRLGSSDVAPGLQHEVTVTGFDSARLNARELIVASGMGELRSSGDLSLAAGATTAESAADWTLRASGALRAEKVATQQAIETAQSLGAKLRFEGASIEYRGELSLASGVATFTATGADGDVRIGGDAVINVAGVTREFIDVTVSSPGGRVEMNARHGDVVVESGARVVVTGGQDADAGTLQVAAPEGQAQLDGSFNANAKLTTDANGHFILDVARLPDFSALNARLNIGGFGGERHLRVRNGDLLVDTNDNVKAQRVILTADGLDGTGNINVRGTIDATGGTGGTIALNAARDVTLRDGAQLNAYATAENNDGGRVIVSTTQGDIAFDSGATIDVRGTRAVATYIQKLDATGAPLPALDEFGAPRVDINGLPVYAMERIVTTDTGSVWFRAPRVSGAAGVAVTALDGDIHGAGSVTVEAFKAVPDSNGILSADELTAMANDAQQFMDTYASAIANRLGTAADARVHLIPGVEVRSAGDLTLNQALDLSAWRFGPRGEAGALTLRAKGDVQLNQNLSDGVTSAINPISGAEEPALRNDESWSVRITAGADTTSADALAVVEGAGDVNLGAGVIVRTGTGDIDIAAGRDLVLQDNTAAIYTLGIDDGQGTLNPLLAGYYLNAFYAVNGGDLRIAAARDINAAPTDQLVNNWLSRIGGPLDPQSGFTGELPTAWAVNFNNFKQGVAALGGGDVAVIAGRDINDVSVSVATTGKQVGVNDIDLVTGLSSVTTNQVDVSGGNRLSVAAGRNIAGGLYYLGQGELTLRADARVAVSEKNNLAPMLALGDARADVRGGTGVELETVFNPTILAQSNIQGLGNSLVPASYFTTYTPKSSVTLTAVTGDVVLGEGGLSDLPFFKDSQSADASTKSNLWIYPATVKVRALEGDVRVDKTLVLFPDDRAQLELLAADSVRFTNITLADVDPLSIPTVSRPDVQYGVLESTRSSLHIGDDQPVRIYAMNGDIGQPPGSSKLSEALIAKSVHLYAGANIRNLDMKVVHANNDDHSVIEAGGDLAYTVDKNSASGTGGLRVSGSGRVDLLVGGSIDLGTSEGVRTLGNREKVYLKDGGADITVMAGLKQQPDYDGFINKYLVETRDYDAALQQFLAGRSTDPSLSATGNFTKLSREVQREFILRVFFSELRKSTPETNGQPADYSPGFNAISTLFPDAGAYKGDLTMLLSQVKTEDGGDINILVPGGLANVGVANLDGAKRDVDQLGIVIAREGNINAFVNGDFLVNSSRVFALDGGDIVLWSSVGDIDAGKGSKSAFSIPAATVIYNTDAKPVAFDPPTAIAGSGIRQAVTTPGKEAGSVYLFAPKGKIDAGDAGIDIAGNLIVGANSVIGTDNIKVGGVSVGVPVSDSGALAGTLSGVSNIASGVSKSAEQSVEQAARAEQSTATPIADAALTFLDIEVLGYGEDEAEDNGGENETEDNGGKKKKRKASQ